MTVSSSTFRFVIIASALALVFSTCKQKVDEPDDMPAESGFPENVSAIMSKCSTPGCHTTQSKEGAGGLALETWEQLFEGGRGGSVAIPYRGDYSTLLYYTNTDTMLGIALMPTMPYNGTPLTAHEYNTLKTWLNNGAPSKSGAVKFADNVKRTTLYICNRGCDVVTVMDAAKGLAMRYISVGNTAAIDAPSVVKVSPDGLNWYVAFNNATVIQKFRTTDNGFVGETEIGLGNWSSITFSADSKFAFVTDNQYNGRVTCVNLETMEAVASYPAFRYPVSSCINAAGTMLYIAAGEGNFIYKINIADKMAPVISAASLEPGVQPSETPSLNPYDIVLSRDEKKYYVSCRRSSQLRILNTANDSLMHVLPVGSNPAKLYVSTSTPYVLLSCIGAVGTSKLASIYIFSQQTDAYIADVYAGHESRGMAMDETTKKLYIANRNVTAGGPAAHHTAVCAGQNGYVSVIDMNNLKLVEGFKKEISVDPYDMGIMQ